MDKELVVRFIIAEAKASGPRWKGKINISQMTLIFIAYMFVVNYVASQIHVTCEHRYKFGN